LRMWENQVSPNTTSPFRGKEKNSKQVETEVQILVGA